MHTSMRSPSLSDTSQGEMRERWLVSIYKEIENFLQNMAIKDADPSLVVKWKSSGRWPLPCQMVFVLKPLTQSQQIAGRLQAQKSIGDMWQLCCMGRALYNYYESRCSTLALMLSLACSADTTWSSIDITSAFLNADIHDDDTVLVTAPLILVKMNIVKAQKWRLSKAREESHLWSS